jgi:hypothetical protein
MRVVPRTVNGKISFYTSHVPKWAQDPEAIGSTPEEIDDLQDKLDAAKEAAKRQKQAQATARSATLALKIALEALTSAGANAILRVRAKAAGDGKPVYIAAGVRIPKKAAPIARPGTPFAFKYNLHPVGDLKLTWKCKNPRGSQGTIYQVYRQLGSDGPFQFLGGTGRKEFIDSTLPAGTPVATYQIQAVRSTVTGDAVTFNVKFGSRTSSARVLARAA